MGQATTPAFRESELFRIAIEERLEERIVRQPFIEPFHRLAAQVVGINGGPFREVEPELRHLADPHVLGARVVFTEPDGREDLEAADERLEPEAALVAHVAHRQAIEADHGAEATRHEIERRELRGLPPLRLNGAPGIPGPEAVEDDSVVAGAHRSRGAGYVSTWG